MGRPKKAQVYRLLDGDEPAVIRYSGDPDEFTALAWSWLADESELHFDYPIALAPPAPRWFRMNATQSDDYAWELGFPNGPGRGNWLGSFLTVIKVGCSECQGRNGQHAPGGCLNADVVGLTTCMLTPAKSEWTQESTRTRAKQMIHLVRKKNPGTPGPTLCSLDRMAPGVSFTMGGGYTWQGCRFTACYMCVREARREFPGLKVSTSMREFAQVFLDQALPLDREWDLTPTPGTAGAWALAGK